MNATTSASPAQPASDVTARAVAFVATHRDRAEALGSGLADLTNDTEGFAHAFTSGLRDLADPAYVAANNGHRTPWMAAVQCGFRRASRGIPTTPLLFVAERLFRERQLEA